MTKAELHALPWYAPFHSEGVADDGSERPFVFGENETQGVRLETVLAECLAIAEENS